MGAEFPAARAWLHWSFLYCRECGELGSGGSSVVRLALQGAFGYVAVKCFNVYGGDTDKRKIVKK